MYEAEIQENLNMNRKDLELRYLEDCSSSIEVHAHPFYEIFFFLEGEAERYVVGGKSYRLRPGDILMLPPELPHHPVFTRTPKTYRRYVLWLSDEYMQKLCRTDPELLEVLDSCREQQSYRLRCATPASRKVLEEHLNVMWEEERNTSCCKMAHLYGLCLNFLVHLNRIVADEHLLIPRYQQTDSLTNKVLGYIHANYKENITLNSVADHFFTSPSSIEMLLTKNVGKPFYRYVTECRIIHAQMLIAEGMPLKEVGLACGYNDYSNFYRAFIRETGVSPSKYRQYLPVNHFQSTSVENIT